MNLREVRENMCDRVPRLEEELNHFDAARRRAALEELMDWVRRGDIVLPNPRPVVNLHAHTFFSFNGYGYSPSSFAWQARRNGLLAAGIVDFDVLDGVEEFLEAGRLLGLRTCAGMETRVYVAEFSQEVMNSPGEPGIAYYMGLGFTTSESADSTVLDELKAVAQRRNLAVIKRVNPFLSPVEIDYERDVIPLTPKGNPTERHVCMAYDRKARELFPAGESLAEFWERKLGMPAEAVRDALASPPALQPLIRSKTMKAGGVGYVQAEGPDFPPLERVAQFALTSGAIPTYAWLDGTTSGEKQIEHLLDMAAAAGTAAVNIVPDRNWNIPDPDLRKVKTANLHRFVSLAQERHLPIAVGTEMNAHGQRFVDDFDAPEMQPLVGEFVEGAYLFFAHTVLQGRKGMGYLSQWARDRFRSVKEKNHFFRELGKVLDPSRLEGVDAVRGSMIPGQVMGTLRGEAGRRLRGDKAGLGMNRTRESPQ